MRQIIVIDLLTVFADQLSNLLYRLNHQLAANGIPGDQLTVFCRYDQRVIVESALGQRANIVEMKAVGSAFELTNAVIAEIHNLFSRLRTAGEPAMVVVLSYRGAVLKAASSYSFPPISVTTFHFDSVVNGELRLAPQSPRTNKSQGDWRFDHVAPKEVALDVLLNGLRERNVTSSQYAIRQNSLRELMALTDKRFHGSSLTTGTLGMISHLVAIAKASGLIHVHAPSQRDKINPFVWLTTSDGLLDFAKSPQPPADAESVGQLVDGSPVEPMPPPEHPLPVQGITTLDISTAPVAEPVEQSAATKAEDTKSPSRSEEMRATLSAIGLGPYPVARVAIYVAIEDAFGKISAGEQAEDYTVRSLLRAAVSRGPEVVTRREFDPLRQQSIWKYAKRLVSKLILESGAFTDVNGEPIKNTLGADLRQIKTIPQDWRFRVDAQIIRGYIAHKQRLLQDEVEDLGGAIFADREDDTYELTVLAIRHLLDEQVLVEVETEEGIGYEIARPDMPNRLKELNTEGAKPTVEPTQTGSNNGNGEPVYPKPR